LFYFIFGATQTIVSFNGPSSCVCFFSFPPSNRAKNELRPKGLTTLAAH